MLTAIGARVVMSASLAAEDVLAVVPDADAVLVGHALLTADIIAQMRRCRVIARYGVGFDNVDLRAATAHGIYVCNVPDYCMDDVATHAIMLALACLRRLPWQIEVAHSASWKGGVTGDIPRLSELTFGVLGLGRIGSTAARKAAGLGFHVIACDPYIPGERFAAVGAEAVSFDDLLARSDVLSLHTPLTDETRGIIDESALRRMKPSAILVNTARGPVVRSAAVARALNEGWIAGAGLDVLEKEPPARDDPLLSQPRAILTPHIAWYSKTSHVEMQARAANEVIRVLTGQKPLNVVNPGVQPRRIEG
jgi:D-3-phosphoglycerate dehydrogenase